MPTLRTPDDVPVDVTQEQADRWEAAAQARDAAIHAAEREYAAATADRDALFDAAEQAFYASLHPRDPNEPVRPIRDLFPVATTHVRGTRGRGW